MRSQKVRHDGVTFTYIYIFVLCLCLVVATGGGGLVTQSCLTLWDPVDCSPPGSSVHGISQKRVLEWVAIPSPGAHPDLGIEPGSSALQADSFPTEPPGKSLSLLLSAKLLSPYTCLGDILNIKQLCLSFPLLP